MFSCAVFWPSDRLLVDSKPCDYLCLLALLLIVLAPTQPNLCHVRILVGCMFSNGATISDLRCHDETKSLLWVHTQGCAARHALISRFLVIIHYRTTPICYSHMSSSLVISPYHGRRSVCWIRYNGTFFWSRPTVNLWRTGHWHELNRLQEMVNKRLYLTVPVMTSVI